MPKLCPQTVEKLWGCEYIYHNEDDYCQKVLVLNHGYRSSLHSHKVKCETFMVIEGIIQLELGDEVLKLAPFDAVTVFPGMNHRFQALTVRALVVESSTKHCDDDVYRLESSAKLIDSTIQASDPRSLYCPRCLSFTRQVDKDRGSSDKICTACGLAFGIQESSLALAGKLRIPKERYI